MSEKGQKAINEGYGDEIGNLKDLEGLGDEDEEEEEEDNDEDGDEDD